MNSVIEQNDDILEYQEEIDFLQKKLNKISSVLFESEKAIKPYIKKKIEKKLNLKTDPIEVYNLFSSLDQDDIFSDETPYLSSACESILGNTPIHTLFPIEDNLGLFETTTRHEEIYWREKAAFGKITDYKTCGMHEFCDYDIDYSSKEYEEYTNQLYTKAVLLMADEIPLLMLNLHPEFFLS